LGKLGCFNFFIIASGCPLFKPSIIFLKLLREHGLHLGLRKHGQCIIGRHLDEGLAYLSLEKLVEKHHAIVVAVFLPLQVLRDHAQPAHL
jgi:hypothetical protein